MIIQAESISFSVADLIILDDINLKLQGGSISVLLGPNGAGKSTLMKILSGFLSPTKGCVNVDGHPITQLTLAQRARRLAVLTQRNQLDFPFTAQEVVAMGRMPYGGDGGELVLRLLDLMEIRPNRIYTSLSGGEKQLVQLGRVFAQVWETGNSGFLLLDEPMTALDLRHQQRVLKLLRQLSEQGTGHLVVMHDINLAAEVADQVVLMSAGRVVASGGPGQVMNEANLSRTFATPMQLITAGDQHYFKAKAE